MTLCSLLRGERHGCRVLHADFFFLSSPRFLLRAAAGRRSGAVAAGAVRRGAVRIKSKRGSLVEVDLTAHEQVWSVRGGPARDTSGGPVLRHDDRN